MTDTYLEDFADAQMEGEEIVVMVLSKGELAIGEGQARPAYDRWLTARSAPDLSSRAPF
jgi:hypothetical protein